MGRPAKATVRYSLPNHRADKYGSVKIRGVLSYDKKRVSFTLTIEPQEIGLMFRAVNSDGSLRKDYSYNMDAEEMEDSQKLSAVLCHFRDVALQIAEKAIEMNVWYRMTSADLNVLLNFVSYPADKDEQKRIFGKDGIFTAWAKNLR